MGAASLAEALKALETRLAVGANLAAVELGALLLVADDLVGGVGFVEALLGLRVGLVWSGWYFLASLRKADLISAWLAVLLTPSTS